MKSRTSTIALLLALTSVVISACGSSSDDEPAAGTERGPCYGNGTCNAGLTCYSNHCVNAGGAAGADSGLGGADASAGDAGSPDSSLGGAGGLAGEGGAAGSVDSGSDVIEASDAAEAGPPCVTATISPGSTSATNSWNYLTTGNGFGFQVFDTNSRKVTAFLEHPYRYKYALPGPSDGQVRRNLAFDFYFGVKTATMSSWLNAAPSVAGTTEYLDQTHIIKTQAALGSVAVESYYFAPFDFPGNALVAILKAPGASDGYALLNFHMGSGGSPDQPDAAGESTSAIGDSMAETGPGGGSMVYVPLTGTDFSNCQGVLGKLGSDLGNVQTCSGNDIVPGLQKKLASDGWWAVAVGFAENAGDAANLAAQLKTWANNRSAQTILQDARDEFNAWRKPAQASFKDGDENRTWKQSEAVLRMSQVREPFTSTRKNTGMLLASLPIGERHTSWVRDGMYATVALARSGHTAEARASLDFLLSTDKVGNYKPYVQNQNYQVSVCRYYGSGEEQADYSGQPTPNVELDGWGLTLWAARQYVESSGDVAWLDSTTKLGAKVYDALVNGIARPLEANLETNGIVRADSSIWEVHDANKKHFAYTTLAAARGFCDLAALAKKLGKTADQQKYFALAKTVTGGFLGTFVAPTPSGAIPGSVEGMSLGHYADGSVVEVFTWNILKNCDARAQPTFDLLANLQTQGGGFKRNEDGASSYDNDEWALIDLRMSDAYRRVGQTAMADFLLERVVKSAAVNFNLIPELYNATPSEGALGKYTGSVPMAGTGAGVYMMTVLDRANLIELNDCGTSEPLY